MDDPLFDPWGPEAGKAPGRAPQAARWRVPPDSTSAMRSPLSGGAPAFEPNGSEKPDPTRPHARLPRERLAGTAGFLRSMAASRLDAVAQRLRLGQHEAWVDDQLDASPAVLRLSLRPWTGPWSPHRGTSPGVLELNLDEEPGGYVLVRTWLDTTSEEPSDERRLLSSRLDGSLLDGLVIDFIRGVLDRV